MLGTNLQAYSVYKIQVKCLLRNAQVRIKNNLRKSKTTCAPQIPQIDFIHWVETMLE